MSPPTGTRRAPQRTVTELPTRSGAGTVAERELRRQLVQLQKENAALNDRVLQKSAELQSARVQIDKTMVTVVELKSQLAQLNNEMDF